MAGKNSLIIYYVLAVGLTWIFWFWLVAQPEFKYLHLVGGLGPAISALIVAGFIGKQSELRRLLDSICRWRVDIWWFISVVLGPFVLFALATSISHIFGENWPDFHLIFQNEELVELGAAYWILDIVFFGFGEEIGWRGYALPKLESLGLNARKASIILSLFWALWHLPLFFYSAGGMSQMNVFMIIGWILSLMFSLPCPDDIFLASLLKHDISHIQMVIP